MERKKRWVQLTTSKSILPLIVMLCFLSCGQETSKRVIDGFAQGTTYHIVYHSKKDIPKRSIDSLFQRFDYSCSVYLPSSLISRINRGEIDTMDYIVSRCVEIAKEVNLASGGYYDITIKPLVEAYGFYRNAETHGEINIDSLREVIGFDKLTIKGNRLLRKDNRMQIDLNSLAQGYTADWIGEWIKAQGVTDFLIEVGGEIYCSGDNQGNGWRIGVDRPIDGNFLPGADLQIIVNISNRALVTSGNYRKNYIDSQGERINHTFNPLTLESATNEMASVTVLAQTAIEADAYATAVMAMGLEKGRIMIEQDPSLEAIFVYNENDSLAVYATQGIRDNIVE